MLYYLGKGTEFKKEECKEYKTKEGAEKALKKAGDGTIWDEKGKVVMAFDKQLENTEERLVTAVERLCEESEGQQDEPEGQESESERQESESERQESESERQEADAEQEEPEGNQGEETESVIWSRAKRVTVVCDGTLNLRRSAEWGNENICGRASKGQSYYVDAMCVVDGRKMLHTVDDIYLSGEPEHVRLEE